jgi:hypothetical protein
MSVSEIASALSGSDAIVFSAGADGRDSAEATKQGDGDGPLKLAAAAKVAKVERFVLVSVFPEAWAARANATSLDMRDVSPLAALHEQPGSPDCSSVGCLEIRLGQQHVDAFIAVDELRDAQIADQ